MNMSQKDEALFLPFMQIPTGHHHVADAIIAEIEQTSKMINCEKIDILSYSYGKIEKLVSTTYLNWIKIVPKAYDLIYYQLAVKNQSKRPRQLLYEVMFTSFFKRMLKENNPRILFCTHALPSNIAGILKRKKQLDAIIVNVYTDFFVNKVWGIEGIDYHFVPSIRVKNFLLDLGVPEASIFVTGIPIHHAYDAASSPPQKEGIHVLVTGGSLGVGAIEKILPAHPSIHYTVLCGHNKKLYKKLQARSNSFIQPIPYIESKEKMNEIYNSVDAVITKPGGVTISECLRKRKPIFSCYALPGQEKVNERELLELGVIQMIQPSEGNVEMRVKGFFEDNMVRNTLEHHLDAYHHHLEKKSLREILQDIYWN